MEFFLLGRTIILLYEAIHHQLYHSSTSYHRNNMVPPQVRSRFSQQSNLPFNFTPVLSNGSEACKGTAFQYANFKIQRFQQLLALDPQDRTYSGFA